MINPLTVLNCDGEYHDPDWVAFHAVFTCLVNYIEVECGGADAFRDRIRGMLAAESEHWDNFPVLHTKYPDKEKYLRERVEEPYGGSLALYEWYLGCDWENSRWINREFYDEGTLKLQEVSKVIWSWWT